MTLRNKIYFIIIAASYFIAVLLVLVVAANAEETGAHAVEQETVTGPAQHDLSLISSQPWLVEGEVLGTLAAYIYKDVTTERPIDYWELYDKAHLLVIALAILLMVKGAGGFSIDAALSRDAAVVSNIESALGMGNEQ